MSLRGTNRDGHVRLEPASDLPAGPPVNVEPTGESLLDLVRRHMISDPSSPKDYAAQIDHYLYGLPKKLGKGKPKSSKRSKKAAGRSKGSRRGTGR